jgi:hypothetical protein
MRWEQAKLLITRLTGHRLGTVGTLTADGTLFVQLEPPRFRRSFVGGHNEHGQAE